MGRDHTTDVGAKQFHYEGLGFLLSIRFCYRLNCDSATRVVRATRSLGFDQTIGISFRVFTTKPDRYGL